MYLNSFNIKERGGGNRRVKLLAKECGKRVQRR
jgi:hypothetical protein